MHLGKVDYSKTSPPGAYRCGDCGAHGVRLFRLYNTFVSHQELRCFDCSMKPRERGLTSFGNGNWRSHNE